MGWSQLPRPVMLPIGCHPGPAEGAKPEWQSSEHGVVVGGLLGDRLDYVPVLNDLAALEPEDVDDGDTAFTRLADGMDVQDHHVAVRQCALDLALGIGELLAPEFDELPEALDA